jgi:hypothetical protein
VAATTTAAAAAADGKVPCKKKPPSQPRDLADDLIPIGILIVVIVVVVMRLPKVDLGHTIAFRRRRLLNWLPLGLSYSFLYFGR